jgi:hypothetical protein
MKNRPASRKLYEDGNKYFQARRTEPHFGWLVGHLRDKKGKLVEVWPAKGATTTSTEGNQYRVMSQGNLACIRRA